MMIRSTKSLLRQALLYSRSTYLLQRTATTDIKLTEANPRDEHLVRVSWSEDKHCDYPHIFLRDNCQCPECFDCSSKQRKLNTVKDIDLNIRPTNVQVNTDSNELAIVWPDGHQSMYCGNWLLERKFPETVDQIKPTYLNGFETKLWPSDIQENLPFIDYDLMMADDTVVAKHIENLLTHGISIVKGAPTRPEVLAESIVQKMSLGYVKTTHYGDQFTVKSKPSPNNLAYTSNFLVLHVDLPFLSYQPGIQLLHCIEQSSGENSGVNHLADGFKAATELKEKFPEMFDILTRVKFKFNDEGSDVFGEFKCEYERPVISLDGFGNIDGINFNNHVRSAFVNAPTEDVYNSYKAYYALMKILYNGDNNIIKYKMSPGDIITFNNRRILHGRTAFDPTTTTRWLEGLYLDWDAVLAKYRVIIKKK